MSLRVAAGVALIMLIGWAAGCPAQTLPSDWPLPGLVPPPGSRIVFTECQRPDSGYIDCHYVIGITTNLTADEIDSYFADQLAPLGLTETDQHRNVRLGCHYTSADELTTVQIDNYKAVRAEGHPVAYRWDVMLTVTVKSTRQP